MIMQREQHSPQQKWTGFIFVVVHTISVLVIHDESLYPDDESLHPGAAQTGVHAVRV